jgi:hypothetical protein
MVNNLIGGGNWKTKVNQNYRPATSHRWTLTHELCWWRKLKNQRKSKIKTCHKSLMNINIWRHELCWWRKLKNQRKSKIQTCHKSPMNINIWRHELCWWRKLKNQRKSKIQTCHKSLMNINTWALLVEEVEEPKKIKDTDLPQVTDEH